MQLEFRFIHWEKIWWLERRNRIRSFLDKKMKKMADIRSVNGVPGKWPVDEWSLILKKVGNFIDGNI